MWLALFSSLLTFLFIILLLYTNLIYLALPLEHNPDMLLSAQFLQNRSAAASILQYCNN